MLDLCSSDLIFKQGEADLLYCWTGEGECYYFHGTKWRHSINDNDIHNQIFLSRQEAEERHPEAFQGYIVSRAVEDLSSRNLIID